MSSGSSISRFTPTVFAYILLLAATNTTISAINITTILSAYPQLSSFSSLLASSGVLAELTNRTAITLLAVPDSYIGSFMDFAQNLSPPSLADLLRYHVLLEFMSSSDLTKIPPSGSTVTTLFQTTGRASSNSGSVNITRDLSTGSITIHSFPSSNTTVLKLIETLPYNVSILAVTSLLIPSGFDLMSSESSPTLGLNITETLVAGHDFNVAVSMLVASGVVNEFEQDERGAGITLFIPTDLAFTDLPENVRLQSLPADKKGIVLKFHVLHSYYPLGSLESIVNPVQPTLATEENGAGSYTLNISRVNGSVAINTGIVQASVTQTVFDQNPVAIFGVSKVLLPKEIFGNAAYHLSGKPGGSVIGAADTPDVSPSPVNFVDSNDTQSHLTSPPGRSGCGGGGGEKRYIFVLGLCCIGLNLLI